MGNTRWADVAETARRTTSADSVAYATEDSGSDAKIGSASHFGSSVSSNSPVAIGRPTTARFSRGECGWVSSLLTGWARAPRVPLRRHDEDVAHARFRTPLRRRG